MRFPKNLDNGQTIGFVAPSFGCATEPYKSAFDNAIKKFKSMGYGINLGPNCYADKGIGISNSPKECGQELTSYYMSGDCDALISCGGGELMCETVDYIDFDALMKADPKWFMGYSDNTNFTFLSTTLMDTAAIYGPCAAAFGMEPWHPAIEDALSLLKGNKLTFTGYDGWEMDGLKDEDHPCLPYNITETSTIRTFPEGDISMSGRLLGGCIDCLVTLLGTKYDQVSSFTKKYKEDGILWFLEACELSPIALRRAMWQMDNAGWFENCSGFIFGRPLLFGQNFMGLDHYKAVVDIISKYNVPILMDADIGHHPPMIPIVSGAMGHLVTTGNAYKLNMDLS